MTKRDNTEKSTKKGLSRRSMLMGAAAGGLLAGASPAFPQAPAVRRKTKIVYWNWADNPNHLKISVDSVKMFNESQNFIEVELDANMAVAESRKKLIVSYAAGAAPDVIQTIQYWVQDLYNNGIIQGLDDYFNKWDAKNDFFPTLIQQARSKPNQPLLYLPLTNIVYFMYYRADWFKEVGMDKPVTFDDMVEAGRRIAKPPERYGYAMRGTPYQAIEVINPIWGSAGVKYADEKGNVDFDSKAAIAVTEKWVDMLRKDKSVQPTAVNDGMRELYSLMQNGKSAMWIYGPQASQSLMEALGDRIQGYLAPKVGDGKHLTLANPEGPMMTSTSKEKEATFEFIKFISSGDAALLYTAQRGSPPCRKSIANHPTFQQNRFVKLCIDAADTYWTPAYSHQHWANFQDRIAPFWQECLRGQITPTQFHQKGAQLLRGEA